MSAAPRLSLFYLTYFGGLGVTLPYLNLYFEKMGFSESSIGILAGVVPLGRIFFSLWWGHRADRQGGRRSLVITGCLLTVGAFWLLTRAESFSELLAVSILLSFADAARLPLVEATTMDVVQRRDAIYGRVRGWGSIGFIVSALGMGAALAKLPLAGVLYAALAWASLNAIAGFALPASAPLPRAAVTSLPRFIARAPVALFLAGALLMQASHGAYYAFFTIHLERCGYSRPALGLLWAVAVLCEVWIMFASPSLLGRMRPGRLMVGCAVLAAARWGLFAAGSGIVLVAAGQALHAFTFGAFHVAAVSWTHRLFPEDLKVSGQALYSGLAFGLGSLLGAAGSGLLFQAAGPWVMYACSSGVAILSAALLAAARITLRSGETPRSSASDASRRAG